MCVICGQALPSRDLVRVQDAWVCLAARGCLVAWVKGASSLSIAALQRSALESTLTASGSLPPMDNPTPIKQVA